MPFIAGYVTRRSHGRTDGKRETKHCYPCAAIHEARDMEKDGRWYGYIKFDDNTKYPLTVQNWTGNLSFIITRWSGPTAAGRYEVWFRGSDGRIWHGIHVHDGKTELTRCRVTKKRSTYQISTY